MTFKDFLLMLIIMLLVYTNVNLQALRPNDYSDTFNALSESLNALYDNRHESMNQEEEQEELEEQEEYEEVE